MANADDIKEKLERLKQQRRAAASAAVPGEAPQPATLPAVPSEPPPAPQPAPAAEEGGGGLKRLFETIGRLLRGGPATPAPSQAPAAEPPVFTVLVAALNGDADGQNAAGVLRLLEASPAFKTRAFGRAFQLDTLEDPAKTSALAVNLRHAVAGEGADALVWGDVLPDGALRLRVATAHPPDDERPGAFGLSTRIELPPNLAEPAQYVLLSSVLAAADPASDAQKAAARKLLPQAAAALEPLAAKPPLALAMGQQRTLQVVLGHVTAAAGNVQPGAEGKPWYEKAEGAYRAALKRLGRNDPPWESGLLHRHVAAVLMARAEREAEPAPLFEEAVKEWREAAETLTRAAMPQEWAAVQTRLGVALYRLDLLTGETELLRDAVQALQSALQVYSRTETPQRWAEIMHNLAQVLEVYGDQMRNVEVLRRAAEACEAVLEIRTRERTPLAWAATQNTLGSALFLLDKHSEDGRHLDHAALALEAALEVFKTYNAAGPAKVAARNLARVRKLAESRRGRQFVEPHWADDDGEETDRRR